MIMVEHRIPTLPCSAADSPLTTTLRQVLMVADSALINTTPKPIYDYFHRTNSKLVIASVAAVRREGY